MRLVFTRGTGKYDRMDVYRPGEPPVSIDCPKQRIIPHDMVHDAVERILGERGFLSRVRDGESASFRMQAEAHSDAVERLVEVFQGDAWSGGTAPPAEMIDLYRITCTERACPMLPVDDAAILAVRAEIERLTAEWDVVPVGGTLTLSM
jgi:hypothetical protein